MSDNFDNQLEEVKNELEKKRVQLEIERTREKEEEKTAKEKKETEIATKKAEDEKRLKPYIKALSDTLEKVNHHFLDSKGALSGLNLTWGGEGRSGINRIGLSCSIVEELGRFKSVEIKVEAGGEEKLTIDTEKEGNSWKSKVEQKILGILRDKDHWSEKYYPDDTRMDGLT